MDPATLFDLSDPLFRELFKNCRYPWEAVKGLLAFLAERGLGKIEVALPEGVFLEKREQISIGSGTRVEPGCFIQGPCFIGKNCQIRHGAYIRGGAVIGDGSTVGHATEVKHSIFLPGASAPHFNYVGDSILGGKVNLGAGTTCANLRLDRKNVLFKIGGEPVDTGMAKLGALIGDGAQIGCHTLLNPGTLIGKGTHSYPSLILHGVIPEKSVVKQGTSTR
jgi:UDP-N-acetylglucosamine diphosphorylase / glucose-1-phosphate thymidylyltransferase / UDP-N-acetylgalactosamine diphosphorylase / glucosamine-1-phosphate N-acetyltransferase / galactosamine-1-phosphate N-acetyltransferase